MEPEIIEEEVVVEDETVPGEPVYAEMTAGLHGNSTVN